MNQENNNLNSQSTYNQQSTQPVQNKFFSQNLFDNNSISDVGSSTTNSASNKVGGHVISWGVGKKAPQEPTIIKPSVQTESLFDFDDNEDSVFDFGEDNSVTQEEIEVLSDEMLNDVNGVVYTNEQPEVLDSDFLISSPQNNFNVQQPINNTNIIDDSINNQSLISDNVINQQPLSMNTLSPNMAQESVSQNINQQQLKYFDNNYANVNQQQVQANEELHKQVQAQQMLEAQNRVVVDPDISVLLGSFVGNKFQKFQMSPFNFGAFLFGGFYFLYRKMYLYGFIAYIIEFLVLLLSPNIIGLAITFVLRLIYAFVSNYLYIKFSNKNVIKIKQKNPKNNLHQLVQICIKKGGTDFLGAFLINLLLNASLGFILINFVAKDLLIDIFGNIKQPLMEEIIEKEEFKGEFKYSNFDVTSEFSFDVPAEFVKTDNVKKTEYKYTSLNDGENNSCIFSLAVVEEYKKSSDLINDLATYNNMSNSIDSTISAGLEWNTFYVNNDIGKVYYRSTIYNNKVYLFEYVSGVNTPDGVCDSYLVSILDSIKVKED